MWRRWGTPHNFILAFIDGLLKPKKSEFWKNEKKNCWRYHHFTQVHQKIQSYEAQFLRHGVRQFFFFVILGHFLPFKNLKNIWRYYPFTHVHHKSKSYDVWFLRYKVQRTTLAATLLTIQKNKILKK